MENARDRKVWRVRKLLDFKDALEQHEIDRVVILAPVAGAWGLWSFLLLWQVHGVCGQILLFTRLSLGLKTTIGTTP